MLVVSRANSEADRRVNAAHELTHELTRQSIHRHRDPRFRDKRGARAVPEHSHVTQQSLHVLKRAFSSTCPRTYMNIADCSGSFAFTHTHHTHLIVIARIEQPQAPSVPPHACMHMSSAMAAFRPAAASAIASVSQLLVVCYQRLARAPPVESCAQPATVIESYLYPSRIGRVAAQIGHTGAHGVRTVKMNVPYIL